MQRRRGSRRLLEQHHAKRALGRPLQVPDWRSELQPRVPRREDARALSGRRPMVPPLAAREAFAVSADALISPPGVSRPASADGSRGTLRRWKWRALGAIP